MYEYEITENTMVELGKRQQESALLGETSVCNVLSENFKEETGDRKTLVLYIKWVKRYLMIKAAFCVCGSF